MLHIVNKSPFQNNALQTCLQVASGGDLLLIEDAVYAATPGTAWAEQLSAAQSRLRVFVLQPDLEARGMGTAVIEGVTLVDYAGFVERVTENATCQSWL
jgi:tRNA 2-thiouridine synthesizing protein B